MSNADLAHLSQQFSGREWPEFLALMPADDGYQLDLYIDPGLTWFAGHFPGQPVLPGIVQTHWAGCIGQYLLDLSDGFSQLQNVKFQTMILPEAKVSLKLQPLADSVGLRFSYFNGETIFSNGKLGFPV